MLSVYILVDQLTIWIKMLCACGVLRTTVLISSIIIVSDFHRACMHNIINDTHMKHNISV